MRKFMEAAIQGTIIPQFKSIYRCGSSRSEELCYSSYTRRRSESRGAWNGCRAAVSCYLLSNWQIETALQLVVQIIRHVWQCDEVFECCLRTAIKTHIGVRSSCMQNVASVGFVYPPPYVLLCISISIDLSISKLVSVFISILQWYCAG